MYECNTNTGTQNPDRPVDVWTQESNEGKILFVVFYTQACRWRRCIGCNFHDNASTKHIDYEHIINQIDYVFDNTDTTDVSKVIFSNGGSMLDEDTFSTTALIYLVYKLNKDHTNVKIISMESRLEYVDLCELEILKRALLEGNSETELEIGIGFEAFNDYIRNDMFDKGLKKSDFQEFLKMVSDYKYSVKCYFMLKPVPDISDDDAINDIKNAIVYLNDCSKKYNVKINMHLNPTYVAVRSKLVEHFENGTFTPPTLIDLAKSIIDAKDIDNDMFSIYVGLSDEGLAVEGGSFINNNKDKLYCEMLEVFNKTQDYNIIQYIIEQDDFYTKYKKSLTCE